MKLARSRTKRADSRPARRAERAAAKGQRLLSLYKTPLQAARTGALFTAFPYPTKISPETVALFIAAHTSPGDTVFDGFAGSGTTGIAALLCASPTDAMRREAAKLKLPVQWGKRHAILVELGELGSFIGRTLCNPPDPERFRTEAERLLAAAERELGWMYEAEGPDGNIGTIRYVIWSEVAVCPNCGKAATLWEGAARRNPARILAKFSCPFCARKTYLSDVRRKTTTATDELTHENVKSRARRPVWVYGSTGKKDWSRAVRTSDIERLRKIEAMALPSGIPIERVPWGDLYRSGYHQGISHLHHFYTRRNLIVFSTLWRLAEQSDLRDALRFWLLSYNSSHGTIMTRVVAKQKQRDFAVTSAQSGVLYVSGLPTEKNLFAGLRRKISVIHAAFSVTRRSEQLVTVQTGSSLETGLADGCIDYVFTDPPFGGNIPYAEVNFLNEAWLGKRTDIGKEVTISRSQGKNKDDYERLLTQALSEIHRILKKNGKATVVFHSASSDVWNALRRAYTNAGFGVKIASILDKTQGSFKQVTTDGAVKGDPILLLEKTAIARRSVARAVAPVVKELVQRARVSSDKVEQTPQRLYSRFVTHYLSREQNVPLNAEQFYTLVASAYPHHVRTSD